MGQPNLLKNIQDHRETGECSCCNRKSRRLCPGCSACFSCDDFECCGCGQCNGCCECNGNKDLDGVDHIHCDDCQKEFKSKKNTNKKSKGVVMTVKSDLKNAGYRVAATQFPKAMRTPLLKALKKTGNNALIAHVTQFLDTPEGLAAFGYLLGQGLTQIPFLSENPKVQALAEEIRISAMTHFGNVVAETAVEAIKPLLSEGIKFLNNLPALEGTKETKLKLPAASEILSSIGNDVTVKAAARG